MSPSNDIAPLDDEAVDWILRLQSPRCTEADRRAFRLWMAQSDAHRASYARVRARLDWLDGFKADEFPLRHAALRYRPVVWKSTAWAVAAMLLLALGLTAFSPDGWYGESARYATAMGRHRNITLADGSQLELNTGTELTVHLNHWRRSVDLLRGEVYFRVVHDPGRPFLVKAAAGRIRDIGTEFDVYQQSNRVVVAVHKGEVRVEGKGETRDLVASQSLVYNAGGDFLGALSKEDRESLTAWRRGKLIFEHRRLDEVLVELGRYRNLSVSLADPALATLTVSGTFFTDRLDNVLETIADSLGVSIRHPSPDEVVLDRR